MSDNHAKVKSRKYASDDDAENLLAGILDDTEDVARAEQERIEAELRAKNDEERRRKEAELQAKKDEAAARLSAEMERLEKVEQRRTQKLEALKIEELKERGEWVDPELERQKLEAKLQEEAEIAAMKQAAEAKARKKHAAPDEAVVGGAAMPAPQAKSNTGLIAGIAVAIVAVVAVVGVVVMGGYQMDQSTYSKAVFAPKEQQVAMVEKSFTPLPKAEPVAVAAADDDTPTKSRRSKSRRKSRSKSKSKSKPNKPISTKPKQSKANARAKALEDALNTDVFGGGL